MRCNVFFCFNTACFAILERAAVESSTHERSLFVDYASGLLRQIQSRDVWRQHRYEGNMY